VLASVLLVLLAGTVSLSAALSAFIVSRACGKTVFSSLCYAAATFTAALTLAFLALSFVRTLSKTTTWDPRTPRGLF
jgi:hypothetical protein